MYVTSRALFHFPFRVFKRNLASALYITGDKAQETFAVLTPHLDLEERLKNPQELEHNIKLRGLSINLADIIRLWDFYKDVNAKKVGLEESKFSISQTIKHLSTKGDKFVDKIETLKAHGKMVKEDLKVLRESIWDVEEKVAVKILSLPNALHPDTPNDEATQIFSYLEIPSCSNFHLDVARKLDLIEYESTEFYFLKNEAALFELASIFFSSDFLLAKNYLQFSNSDFARSVIVEGCGQNYTDSSQIFTVQETEDHFHENSRLHLVGGATFPAFMAYYARHTVFPSQLPLKYFSVGKKYSPVAPSDTSKKLKASETSEEHQSTNPSQERNFSQTASKLQDPSNDSLLNVTQETCVNIFLATLDNQMMDKEFATVLQDFIQFYQQIGHHFRVCYLPVKQLEKWESLRASFQMYSPHLNEYVEVGYVSLCGNYISKRLVFNYGKGTDANYPCVITGSLFSAQKLLACILESGVSCTDELLPNTFKKCV